MNQEIKQIPKKYSLERDSKEKLKIFYMIFRPGINPPMMNEKVFGIVGYNVDEARTKAMEIYKIPKGSQPFIIISYGDHALIEDILKRVDKVGSIKTEETKEVIIMPPKLGKEQFVNNIKLACDEFAGELLENEKDREDLKKLVNKFKIKV